MWQGHRTLSDLRMRVSLYLGRNIEVTDVAEETMHELMDRVEAEREELERLRQEQSKMPKSEDPPRPGMGGYGVID